MSVVGNCYKRNGERMKRVFSLASENFVFSRASAKCARELREQCGYSVEPANQNKVEKMPGRIKEVSLGIDRRIGVGIGMGQSEVATVTDVSRR